MHAHIQSHREPPRGTQVSTVYEHVRGTCLVHMGRHRHGANDIEDGERNNLIIWCKSSSYRWVTDAHLLAEEEAKKGGGGWYSWGRGFGIMLHVV